MPNFEDAINSSSHTVSSRTDVVEYYRDAYGADWKKHIVDDLQKQFPDAKRASLSREFQYDKRTGQERYKGTRVAPKTAERYKTLGQSIGRIPNKKDIEIIVKGKQRGNKGRPDRDRTIKATLRGDKAQSWVNDPNLQDIWDAYGFDFDGEEDGDYFIDVASVSAS